MAEKTVDINSSIMSRNERLAGELRARFAEAGTYCGERAVEPRLRQELDDPRHERAPGVDMGHALRR